MEAMVAAMAGKVDKDQRVAAIFGRTGENRTCQPNGTELELVVVVGGRVKCASRSGVS